MCGRGGPAVKATGAMRGAFAKSSLTGFWYHVPCGKPKQLWWEGHVKKIQETTGEP